MPIMFKILSLISTNLWFLGCLSVTKSGVILWSSHPPASLRVIPIKTDILGHDDNTMDGAFAFHVASLVQSSAPWLSLEFSRSDM